MTRSTGQLLRFLASNNRLEQVLYLGKKENSHWWRKGWRRDFFTFIFFLIRKFEGFLSNEGNSFCYGIRIPNNPKIDVKNFRVFMTLWFGNRKAAMLKLKMEFLMIINSKMKCKFNVILDLSELNTFVCLTLSVISGVTHMVFDLPIRSAYWP